MRTVCSRIRLPRRERNTPPARISNLLVNLLQELTPPWDPRAFSSPSRWLRCGTAAKPELTLSVHHGNHAVQQPAAAVVGSPAAGQPRFLLPSGERAAAGHAPPAGRVLSVCTAWAIFSALVIRPPRGRRFRLRRYEQVLVGWDRSPFSSCQSVASGAKSGAKCPHWRSAAERPGRS